MIKALMGASVFTVLSWPTSQLYVLQEQLSWNEHSHSIAISYPPVATKSTVIYVRKDSVHLYIYLW